MKLLALKAIGKIAARVRSGIYLRSTEDNRDHEEWQKLSREMAHWEYTDGYEIHHGQFVEQELKDR